MIDEYDEDSAPAGRNATPPELSPGQPAAGVADLPRSALMMVSPVPRSERGQPRTARHALPDTGAVAPPATLLPGPAELPAGPPAPERPATEEPVLVRADTPPPALPEQPQGALFAQAPAPGVPAADDRNADKARDPAPPAAAGSGPPGRAGITFGELADGRHRPGVPAPASQPERGSLADLRRRLARLPHGHPSSPYHDDGERRPQPPRLRHLELAPPAREIPARTVLAREGLAAHVPAPDLSGSDLTGGDVTAGDVTAGEVTASDVRTGERPAAEGPPASPPPRPAPTAAAAPTASPPPLVAPDGSWSWGQLRLGRGLVRIADDAYDRFRAAEGRDLFGGYGNGGLTPMVYRVAERVARGTLAPDTARYALLEPDVFRARFAELLSRHPDRAPEHLARRVPGAISYTFVLAGERYADGIAEIQEALEIQGFQLQARRNTWSSEANRCVLTVWHDPLTDLPFRIQFHTAASLDAQRLARTTAALISDPRIPPAEAASLRSDIRTAWAALPAPPGTARIPDYLRDSGSTARL
jgi:hypothetical protein